MKFIFVTWSCDLFAWLPEAAPVDAVVKPINVQNISLYAC